MAALGIFDPKKVPNIDSTDLSSYGEESLSTLLAHCGMNRPVETLQGEKTVNKSNHIL